MSDIIDLTMIPFGNAKFSFNNKMVICQHGNQECEGNRWELCAIKEYPSASDYFPFYLCMEKAADKMLDNVQKCATEAKMDYSKLSSCYADDSKSLELEKAAHAATPADHKYVPWVLVDGKHSPSDGKQLLSEVCKAYTGTKPAGCPAELEESNVTCSADW